MGEKLWALNFYYIHCSKTFQNTSLNLSGTIQLIFLVICQTITDLEKMAAHEWA
jgi:hypothetical protein